MVQKVARCFTEKEAEKWVVCREKEYLNDTYGVSYCWPGQVWSVKVEVMEDQGKTCFIRTCSVVARSRAITKNLQKAIFKMSCKRRD